MLISGTESGTARAKRNKAFLIQILEQRRIQDGKSSPTEIYCYNSPADISVLVVVVVVVV